MLYVSFSCLILISQRFHVRYSNAFGARHPKPLPHPAACSSGPQATQAFFSLQVANMAGDASTFTCSE